MNYLHGRMSARVYEQRYQANVELWKAMGKCPEGRITLHRWAKLNGKLWSEAVALAESGALPGYIAEGRWIALDLSVEPIELRLKLSGWHMPKKLAPDLYVNPKGMIRVRPKTGD